MSFVKAALIFYAIGVGLLFYYKDSVTQHMQQFFTEKYYEMAYQSVADGKFDERYKHQYAKGVANCFVKRLFNGVSDTEVVVMIATLGKMKPKEMPGQEDYEECELWAMAGVGLQGLADWLSRPTR